jgi:hypothetical protein
MGYRDRLSVSYQLSAIGSPLAAIDSRSWRWLSNNSPLSSILVRSLARIAGARWLHPIKVQCS